MRPLNFIFGGILLTYLATGNLIRLQASIFSAEEESVEGIQSILRTLPKEDYSKKKAILYSHLGDLHYHKGQNKEAAEAYEQALKCQTNSEMKAHLYRYLGKSYEGFERLDRAIEASQLAVQYDRKYWRCHRDLARLYEKVLLYPKAVDSYLLAIKYNAKDASLYTELGRTWRKMGLYETAEACLKKAESLGERSPLLFQEVSLVCEGESRYEEAAQATQKSLSNSSTPKDWGRLIYLAVLAGNKEMANEGLNNLRKMETSPDTVPFYEELVDIMQRSPRDILTMNISDPTLNSLIQSVRPKSLTP